MLYPFGEWLRAELEQRGHRQADLWRYLGQVTLGVSRSAVTDWCAGRTVPENKHLNAICDFLHLDAAGRSTALRVAALPKREAA